MQMQIKKKKKQGVSIMTFGKEKLKLEALEEAKRHAKARVLSSSLLNRHLLQIW